MEEPRRRKRVSKGDLASVLFEMLELIVGLLTLVGRIPALLLRILT